MWSGQIDRLLEYALQCKTIIPYRNHSTIDHCRSISHREHNGTCATTYILLRVELFAGKRLENTDCDIQIAIDTCIVKWNLKFFYCYIFD